MRKRSERLNQNSTHYTRKRVLLVDGDILLYKIALQNEEAVHWGDGLWTLHCYEDKCKGEVDSHLANLKLSLNAKNLRIALTSHENFRKDVLPSYKENRKQKRKPLILPVLRKYLIDKYKAQVWDGLEADDVLGIMATTSDPYFEFDKIIVSIDKDMRQIPCAVSADGVTFKNITRGEADYWFMMQTLMGDTVDGYAGLPSVGPKSAEKILGDDLNKPLKELWHLVLQAYIDKGYTKDEAIQQARVARILRKGEYNRKTKKVKLWQTT
jgi:DNA polymerase-1